METKRIYLDRQPIVGDSIIATEKTVVGDFRKGYEYKVAGIRDGYVVAYGDRIPNSQKDRGIVISDGSYAVYEDVFCKPAPSKKEKLKETQEYVYRLLGIPIYKRTVKIYDEKIEG